ncbi:ScyD/ScyE family protein [Fibrella sp. HMF5335]|uniref:ScyD/ScyE family protein n=1 Tax=Fibrella rubiginis TaxID=2817060 RepID=A0A939K2R7_9BACT|nr:ScyD/ScyE family protein [Fibrella rubiginis]MBO0938482.1 ScyD/ScyE family protein [Fibrella rubiginis]
MLRISVFLAYLLVGLFFTSCDHVDRPLPALQVSTLTSGLVLPIGVETDPSGRLWVTESGTGKNDARLMMITPADGKAYPIVTGFASKTIVGGEIQGLDHLLYADGILYVLGTGFLYKVDIRNVQPGQAPVDASTIPREDIASFVLAYNFTNNAHDSHPYNMTIGPDGLLYISDAGANAILRRLKNGMLNVVAEIPGIANPTPIGPPQIQSVPTSILYDGQKYLVSTLLGFPFPAGRAIVYQVDQGGGVSVFQQGFNSLVGVKLDANNKPLVLEYGLFGQQGWVPNTGRILRATGTTSTVLLDKLDRPTDLKRVNANTYYLTSLGEGSVKKVTF